METRAASEEKRRAVSRMQPDPMRSANCWLMSVHFAEITRAVVQALGRPVTHLETVHVVETFHGLPVWDAEVELFEADEPPRIRVYGCVIEAADKAEYLAILGHPPIDSPVAA